LPPTAAERRAAVSAVTPNKPYKGLAMEGLIARWYARNTGRSMEPFRNEAEEIARHLPQNSAVLEVAPGPGFLAIELANLGFRRIVGLDISKSFVRIATENAARAGVDVTFREGNVSSMPFEPDSFDFICCRAAFKNFSDPELAFDEMHRVLRPGGKAVIHDMRQDASPEGIKTAVNEMGLGWLNSLLTRWILRRLRKRAYSQDEIRRMVGKTPFRTCEITCDPIGMKVSLVK
jgi:ubiquinone/menaquinone biosynthesis C-methylase UbiE